MSPQGRWGSSIPGQPAPCILALFPQQTCPLSVVRLNILVWREGRREPEVPTSQSVRPWGGEGGSWARPPPARRQRCPAPPPAAPAAQTSREDLGRSPGESAPLSRAGSAAFCSPLAGGWQASWTAFCSAPWAPFSLWSPLLVSSASLSPSLCLWVRTECVSSCLWLSLCLLLSPYGIPPRWAPTLPSPLKSASLCPLGPARPDPSPRSHLQKPGLGRRQGWHNGSTQAVRVGSTPARDPPLLGISPGHTRG